MTFIMLIVFVKMLQWDYVIFQVTLSAPQTSTASQSSTTTTLKSDV